jgi:hypothetical protein
MNCKRIRARLELLAGDDLAGRDAAEVEAHLRSCLNCYREYVELRDLLVEVRAAGRPHDVVRTRGDSEAFVAGVMQRIQGPPPAAPRLLPRLAMVSGWAAALVLGLTVGWYRWHLERTPPHHDLPNVIDPGRGGATYVDRVERELSDQFDEMSGGRRNPATRRADEVKPAVHRPPKSF